MLKKTLIATAITLASFGSMAAVIAVTPDPISIQGAAGEARIPVPNTTVTVAAEYVVGDTFTFTITGASFTNLGATLNAACPK